MKTLQIVYSSEMKALHEKGWEMIEKGQVDKALVLWEKGFTEAGYLYPPSLQDFVQLHAHMGEFDLAESYLDLLEQLNEIEKGEWEISILISRMMLSFRQGDMASARLYISQLEQLELEPEDREMLAQLIASIDKDSGQPIEKLFAELMMDEIMGLAQQQLIEELSRKELPVNPTLSRALRNLPVNWINGTCELLDIEGQPRRPQREKQIIARLTSRDCLVRICDQCLEMDERELLIYLLKKDGWSRFQSISRIFGGLEGENYFWPEEGPCTMVGALWSLGLIMVGQTLINGRRTRIATIPVELREVLREILGAES